MVMALAKELAPGGVRINVVALGPLTEGVSRSLDARLRDDHLRFSALRRFGTPPEAASAITWMALDNEHTNGKVLTANGGI